MTKPAAKFTAGQVSAAIWENEVTTKTGKKVTMLKASGERRYKDRDHINGDVMADLQAEFEWNAA